MNKDRHQQFTKDVEQLGQIVEDEMRRMPSYVEHHPDVDEVGRLSSEALAMSYEASAKQIEAMGESLVNEMKEVEKASLAMVKEAEQVKRETADAVASCAAAAEVYRSQAKEIFEKIQHRSMIAAKVRQTAQDMIREVEKP